MANPILCNVLTRFPTNKFSQIQLSSIFKNFCEKVYNNNNKLSSSSSSSSSPLFPYTKAINSLFQNTTIKERSFIFYPEIDSNRNNHNNENNNNETKQQRDKTEEINTKAIIEMGKISDECANSCLLGVGLEKKNIDNILSYTPMHSSPGYTTKFSGYKKDVLHTPIHGLASSGGVALLSYAAQYTKAYPERTAMNLTMECGSRLWQQGGSFDVFLRNLICDDIQKNKEEIYQQMVVGSLLGDGTSATVVIGRESPFYNIHKRKGAPEIVDSYSAIVPDTSSCLGSNLTESGTQVFMSRQLADVAPIAMVDAVKSLLQRNKLSQKDISLWLAHPGGPRILQTVQDTLSMSQNDFRYSWEALAEVGNVSSVSVLRAYEICMKQNPKIASNTFGVMVAVGPGVRVEALLLKW